MLKLNDKSQVSESRVSETIHRWDHCTELVTTKVNYRDLTLFRLRMMKNLVT